VYQQGSISSITNVSYMVVVDAMHAQYLDHTSEMHSTVYSKNIYSFPHLKHLIQMVSGTCHKLDKAV